jgi:hypothetical protein
LPAIVPTPLNSIQKGGLWFKTKLRRQGKIRNFENVEMNNNLKEIISTTVDSCKTVYFYLETSGFGR